MNTLIEDFRYDIRAFVRSVKTRNEITETLRTRLGFPGKFLNVTRIKEYEEMADIHGDRASVSEDEYQKDVGRQTLSL